VESRLFFGLYVEGNSLVLRRADGTEERRVDVSDSTLQQFDIEDVATDLKATLSYEMKDQQGSEDIRR
jgi:hypothetical protein